jgi:BirA family biotin operon repressor/biotin-[acetyl-CoA-carboxylase] ligase
LIGGKKIAGVLIETVPYKDGIWVIAGIGLNVSMSDRDLAAIDQPATSLLAETGAEHSLDTLEMDLIARFSTDLQQI